MVCEFAFLLKMLTDFIFKWSFTFLFYRFLFCQIALLLKPDVCFRELGCDFTIDSWKSNDSFTDSDRLDRAEGAKIHLLLFTTGQMIHLITPMYT